MAQIQLANFADSTLASGILDGDLALTFSGSDPTTTFPTVTGSDWFYAVLVDTSANREIVKVTAHAAGTRIMTIVRAQEGTTALGFATGSLVSLRLTVQAFTDFVDAIGVTASGIQAQSYSRVTTFSGAADALTGAVTPALATYPTGLRVTGIPNLANATTTPTLDVGTPGAKTIKKRDVSGTAVALAVGDYNPSGPFDFEYNGTDFILLNPVLALAEIAQIVYATAYTTATSTVTTILIDTSIPNQTTDGVEILTVTIVPKFSTSSLLVEAFFSLVDAASGTNYTVAAIFRDSTANAIGVSAVLDSGSLSCVAKVAAVSVASTTFKLRWGRGSSGTAYINRDSSGNHFGGITAVNFRVTEITA